MNINDAIYKTRGKNDECYTPEEAVTPLLEIIPKDLVIWCPFDTEESEFVKVFQEDGYKVIHSHIENNENFYTYEPNEKWDIIISNPPFTNKKGIFERAFSFNKPFVLLMTAQWLNDSTPVKLYQKYNKEMQIIHFDQRVRFKNCDNKIPFKSVYFCSDILKQGNILINL
jgi:hypothetical protein